MFRFSVFGAGNVFRKGSIMQGIRFMQRIRQEGSAIFCYNAVRPLGEDFEESVGYNFTFLEGGAMDEMFGHIVIQNPLPPTSSFQTIFFQVVKVDGWFLIKIPSWRFCICDHYSMFFSLFVGVKGLFIYIGSYKLAWTRTYDAWSSQGEQHIGKWTIDLDQIHCETLEPESSSETEMRYAPAGYKFAIPLKDILILDVNF